MECCAVTLDITPTGPVVLAASDNPPYRSTGVAEPLEATILGLRTDDRAAPIIIVSVDLLYAGRLLRRAVENALPELPPENIVLAASHTHRAPMTDDTKPVLAELDTGYLGQLTAQLGKVRPGSASMPWRPVGLETGTTSTPHAINRRRKRRIVGSRPPQFNVITLAPNPDGFTDDELTVLVGRDPKGGGDPLFVLWNYACHPVAHPSHDLVAAHFPHVVRSTLRDRLSSPHLPVCYLQGFSGNLRPSASAPAPGAQRNARSILTGPQFAAMTPDRYREWSQSLANVVADAVEAARPTSGAVLTARRTSAPSESFVAGAREPEVTFQSVRFTEDLCLAGASAEVVAEYAPRVRKLAAHRTTMTVGCLDHPFGYAATTEMLAEGGYEASGFCPSFGLTSVNPAVERAMMAGFRSVLDEPAG